MRQSLRTVELDQLERKLAPAHPVQLEARPDIGAVVLCLADIRLARYAVSPREPVLDAPSRLPLVEDTRERGGMLDGAIRLAPANPQAHFRLPEVEPRRDLRTELLVHERIDEFEHPLVLHTQGDEVHLGPGFHRFEGAV